MSESENETTAAENQPQPRLSINAQYVKDLSFENPNAPQSLGQNKGQPTVNISVNVQAKGLAPTAYEVELKISAEAKHGDESAFIAELAYAGLFTLENFPQEALEPVCMIECPRILFPFARRVIADVTRDGAYPPLLLEPIDFTALYQQQRAHQQVAAEEPAQG